MSYTLTLYPSLFTSATHGRGSLASLDRLLGDIASEARLDDLVYDAETRTYRAELDLPGYKREEVSVEAARDGVVTVTAESKSRGKVARSYWVDGLDVDKVEARLEHGVLLLSVPLAEASRPKRVQIT